MSLVLVMNVADCIRKFALVLMDICPVELVFMIAAILMPVCHAPEITAVLAELIQMHRFANIRIPVADNLQYPSQEGLFCGEKTRARRVECFF